MKFHCCWNAIWGKKELRFLFSFSAVIINSSIRITEVGGRYSSFHVIFINFYKCLQSLEWEKDIDISLKENGNKLKRKFLLN